MLLGSVTESTVGITLPLLTADDSHAACHLSVTELSSIATAGQLTIGSSSTAQMYVGGLIAGSISSSIGSVILLASHNNISITLTDMDSEISIPMSIVARDGVTFDSSLTVNVGVGLLSSSLSSSGLSLISS